MQKAIEKAQTGGVVTHIVEVEDPTTGISRMFSGVSLDEMIDRASDWLDGHFGGVDEWEPIVWED